MSNADVFRVILTLDTVGSSFSTVFSLSCLHELSQHARRGATILHATKHQRNKKQINKNKTKNNDKPSKKTNRGFALNPQRRVALYILYTTVSQQHTQHTILRRRMRISDTSIDRSLIVTDKRLFDRLN